MRNSWIEKIEEKAKRQAAGQLTINEKWEKVMVGYHAKIVELKSSNELDAEKEIILFNWMKKEMKNEFGI